MATRAIATTSTTTKKIKNLRWRCNDARVFFSSARETCIACLISPSFIYRQVRAIYIYLFTTEVSPAETICALLYFILHSLPDERLPVNSTNVLVNGLIYLNTKDTTLFYKRLLRQETMSWPLSYSGHNQKYKCTSLCYLFWKNFRIMRTQHGYILAAIYLSIMLGL